MGKKDSRDLRKKMSWSIFISLICMNFPIIALLDLLDFNTMFEINLAYAILSSVLLFAGFYLLLTTRSAKMRFISGFFVYLGFDLFVMVITNYI